MIVEPRVRAWGAKSRPSQTPIQCLGAARQGTQGSEKEKAANQTQDKQKSGTRTHGLEDHGKCNYLVSHQEVRSQGGQGLDSQHQRDLGSR